MPSETSSAPREVWAVIDPTVRHEGHVDSDGIWPTGLVAHTTDEDRCRSTAQYRDEAFNRTRPERKHLPTGYVRRDLVVPTVDELAEDGQRMFGWKDVEAFNFAEFAHRLLLSRIEGDGRAACSEGDNDER